jgi:hypothetical protein
MGTTANLNSTTPSALSGTINTTYQADGSGNISSSVPIATTSVLGVVQADGTSITISGGVISAAVGSSKPYDCVVSLPGMPGAGAVVFLMTFTRAVTFAGNFSGSYGTVGTNPTGTATYTVKKNGSSTGTIVVSTGGTVTFTTSGGSSVSFAAGDRCTITAPGSQDATLADCAFTLAGTR